MPTLSVTQRRGDQAVVPDGASVRVSGAACPAGSFPIGGGYEWNGPRANATVVESLATGDKWRFMFRNNAGRPRRVSVITQCVTGK